MMFKPESALAMIGLKEIAETERTSAVAIVFRGFIGRFSYVDAGRLICSTCSGCVFLHRAATLGLMRRI